MPIMTGTVAGEPAGTQMQYQDIGLAIEAHVSRVAMRSICRQRLSNRALQVKEAELPAQDPVVRQTTFNESSVLSQDKPMILGSLDLPGTTRSQEIAVVAQLVR